MTTAQSIDEQIVFSSRELVEHLYLGLLGRHSDPVGLASYTSRLETRKGDLAAILGEIVSSNEFQSRLAGLAPSASPSFWGQSQHGELPLVLTALLKSGSRHQYVVDVGARGRERSNSYDLLTSFGWSGLLIEANPSLVGRIREEFEGTNYRLENVAISTYDGEAQFFVADNPDVSSLTEGAVRHWGGVADVVTTKVRRLPEVLSAYAVPLDFDVLSLDIEGEDVAVFNDLVRRSSYRPKYVFIEVHDTDNPGTLEGRHFCEAATSDYNLVQRIGPNLFLSRVDS